MSKELAFLIGYQFGAIPFGLLLMRMAGGPDLRTVGSGNIGATNVLRTGHKGLAAATLICDALKGTVAVWLAAHYSGAEAGLWAGAGAFAGHLFPIWLKFKGGKGVATYIGVLIGLCWQGAVIFCAIWLAVAGISRYSSLAALIASALTPPALWLFGQPNIATLCLAMSALMWLMHRANIRRLLKGSEGKIGANAPSPR
ncbi:MAG: glycerol-3-phosphate 1-O-acyltransferase PlsY [Pseudolabrys sp.]